MEKKTSKSEHKEKDLEYLYQRRERLDHDRFELSNSLDKYLFTATTGALALILSFLQGLGDDLKYLCLIIVSISFFILCLISVLISIKFSVQAYKKQMEITDQSIKHLLKPTNSSNVEISNTNHWSIGVRYISYMSLILFVLGILLTVSFYFLNFI